MMRKILILPVLIASAVVLLGSQNAYAIDGWNAGRIMDDSIFTNSSTMNAAQIQSFLNSKVPACDTYGRQASEFGGGTRAQWAQARYGQSTFTCLRDYTENGKSAAQIIYDTSQKYTINPQVLIVLLQKEQGLVTDTWPLNIQYKTATGYGCPDTAPCDSQYYGLANQLDWSGKMFRAIMNNSPTWYTPYVLGNNFIRYSPDSNCGGSTVYIQNRATQALYNYTPYQPNPAALNAGYGTASCGAYGNRNFYLYFTDWFGKTTGPMYAYTETSKTFYKDANKTEVVDVSQLAKNQYIYAEVKVKNTGSQTWNRGQVYLATAGPNDRQSRFCTMDWAGLCARMATVNENQVATEESGTFNFWMKTPTQAGSYNEYFNLVAENISWFSPIGSYIPFTIRDTLSAATDTLTSDSKQSIKRGEMLFSNDKSSVLTLTPRGTLELYRNGKKIWDAGVASATYLVMQNDGNLVLYDGAGSPLWAKGRPGGQSLKLANSGDLTLSDATNVTIWSSGTTNANSQTRSFMDSDTVIYRDQSVYSSTENYRLILQGDGNLVMYNVPSGRAVWASNTPSGAFLVQQNDGNFVLYDDFAKPVWSSNISGQNIKTYIQDDGNLVSYSSRGAVWAGR